MKNIFVIVLTISILFFVFNAKGQTWQWANTAKVNAGKLSEGWIAKTDLAANVIISAVSYADSIGFGPFELYNPLVSVNSFQILTVKYSATGNVLWARASQNGEGFPIGISTDTWQNILLYGWFSSDSLSFGPYTLHRTPSSIYNYFLVKYDLNGNVSWAKSGGPTYPTSNSYSDGGIATDGEGNTYINGAFDAASMALGSATLTNSSSGTDIYIAKFDTAGNVLWAKRFGGTDYDYSNAMDVMPNGDAYMAGIYFSPAIQFGNYTVTNNGVNSIYIVRSDAAGNIKWAKSAYGGAQQQILTSLVTDKNANVYICGGFFDTLKFGTYQLVNASSNHAEAFIAKYDSSGNVQWAKAYGTQGTNYHRGNIANSLAIDKCNNVWLTGTMDTNIVLDGQVLNAPAGSTDPVFIACLGPTGNIINYQALASGGDDNNGIAADDSGYVFVTGDFQVSSLTLGNHTLNKTGFENIYVAKYGPVCTTTEIKQANINPEINIYPNPASNQFTIRCSGTFLQNTRAALYNITGQLVYSSPLKEQETIVYTGALSPGIYFCKIIAEGQSVITKKVLVEK